MIETMYHYNGVGLAAPQIGLGKSIFIAIEPKDSEETIEQEDALEPETIAEKREAFGILKEHVIINPKIVSRDGEALGLEGCLSLPALTAENVERAESIVLEFQNIKGQKETIAASGYFARIIQHEYDHLKGRLFFERLSLEQKKEFLETNRQDLAEFQREAKAMLKELKQKPQNFHIS